MTDIDIESVERGDLLFFNIEGRGVDHRTDQLDSPVAERLEPVCRLAADPARDQGDQQRPRVAQVVQRVGDQRETTRQEATDRLHHGEETVHRDGHQQPRVAHRGRGVTVGVVSVVPAHRPDCMSSNRSPV